MYTQYTELNYREAKTLVCNNGFVTFIKYISLVLYGIYNLVNIIYQRWILFLRMIFEYSWWVLKIHENCTNPEKNLVFYKFICKPHPLNIKYSGPYQDIFISDFSQKII